MNCAGVIRVGPPLACCGWCLQALLEDPRRAAELERMLLAASRAEARR